MQQSQIHIGLHNTALNSKYIEFAHKEDEHGHDKLHDLGQRMQPKYTLKGHWQATYAHHAFYMHTEFESTTAHKTILGSKFCLFRPKTAD